MATDRAHIEDEAAAFLQKRDTGPWTAADAAELSAWLDASTAHRVAYLRTEAAWEAMGRLKALGAGLPAREVPSSAVISAAASPQLTEQDQALHGSAKSSSSTRGRSYRLAAAAAVVLFAGGLALWGYQAWFQGERYTTPIGGLESVPLADGSRIILNTGSRINVVLSENERHIDLAQGEAFFEVAKNPTRPFVVQAKHTRIVAVGTQFAVRREGEDEIQVLVTEGKVRVDGQDGAPVTTRISSLNGKAQQSFVSAGEVAHIGPEGVTVRDESSPQAEEALAWRDGYLVFRETTLADAVAQFNRYSIRQIAISDPAVAQMPLTGKFKATNSEAFISLLEQTFHIRAHDKNDEIILSRADSP